MWKWKIKIQDEFILKIGAVAMLLLIINVIVFRFVYINLENLRRLSYLFADDKYPWF